MQGWLGLVAMMVAANGCAPAMNPDVPNGGMDVPNVQDTFRPDTNRPDTFRPPADTFVPPPEDTFVPPADTFVPPPEDTFVPPADVPNVDVPNFDVPNRDVPTDIPNPPRDVPNGLDVPSDVPPAPGCGLMVEPMALAVPAAGMTTTVTTTLNAMGMGGMNAGTSCQPLTGGSERIFRLTLAARTTIQLAATAMDANTDTVLEIRRNCASSATAVVCDDDSGPSTNSLIRRTLEAGEYFVVLDEYGAAAAATGGMVTLTLQTVTPAANATCAGAAPLMVGAAAMGNTITSGGDANPMTCSAFNNGPQLYYSYTIPANTVATFTAAAMGMPAWTPFIRVFNSCATENVCTASASSTVMVRNATMNPQMVVVSVAAPSIDSGGAFTLNTAIAMIPATAYTVTTNAMADCTEDLSMAPLVTWIPTGMPPMPPVPPLDDESTAFAALPFAFNYFAAPVTHWAVNTNGLAQLGAAGSGDPAYSNTTLPSASAPTGALAVFWDDGEVGALPEGVRTLSRGVAPNRSFIIEWTHHSLAAANALRYRVKLFETSNIIEYHYCSMTGPMGSTVHTGSSATIGLQSVDRMRGQLFAMPNTANQIGAGAMPVVNRIIWTPNP